MFHLGVKNVSPEKVSTKTLSIKFYLKPIKNKENTFVVHTQIVFNRTKAEFTTGLRCLNTEWNDSKEEFRKNSVYNQQLSTIKSKVFRIKNQLDESASFYNAADIKKQLLGNQQSDAKLLIYFEDYIQRNLKNDAWSKATRRLYSNTYNYLECFLSKHGAKRITLNQFDLILIGKFDDYLKQVVWNELGARLSVSSINKHHARLKAVLNDAISRGELVNKNYSKFKLSFPSSNREYLNKDELTRINSLDFSHNKPLEEKVSILDDIDFELELLHRDRVNVAYIIKLLSQLKDDKTTGAEAKRKAIIDLLGGDVQLRSKRELIEKFIEENLPFIIDTDKIEQEFDLYWKDQKVLALGKICEEENLDKAQFKSLINAYIYSGQEPIRDDVFKCLDNRPSILQARHIGERIIEKMREFVEVFVNGMTG